MTVSIVTVGDEILNGYVRDTNSTWIARLLNEAGLEVIKIISVADKTKAIIEGLEFASLLSDLILITGGLGPTKDDVTNNALASYFKDELIFRQVVYKKIQKLFEASGKVANDLHKLQCYLPKKAQLLDNKLGTAPGLWFEEGGKIYVAMPGVPFEMKHMFQFEIIPKLNKKTGQKNSIVNKTILTAGEGESRISMKIKDIQDDLPPDIKIAFLPSLGSVKIRLSGSSLDYLKFKSEIETWTIKISNRLKEYVYGFDDQTLESVLGDICLERKVKIATAESCTGGYIAHRITSIPGSSEYFLGSVVSYSNKAKCSLLNVRKDTLVNFGAVSKETVVEMLEGLLHVIPADLGVAVSGIAGPGGGTEEKPVGTIWLAWGNKNRFYTHKLQLSKHRLENIEYSAIFAMNMMRKFLMEQELV